MAGEEKNFQPPFFCKKMANEDVSILFTLLCQQKLFTQNRRFSSLPRRNEMKPGHLHRTPEKTYLLVHRSLVRRWMKSLPFISLVKRSACAAREVAACRRVDVFLIKSAPTVLTRRQAALIFPLAVIYYVRKEIILLKN